MKNKLAQLQYLVTRIDRQHIQLAYFAIALFGFVFLQAPADGGGGPR